MGTTMVCYLVDRLYFLFLWLRCIALKDSESVDKIWKVSTVLHICEVVPYADDIFVRRWSPCHHQIVP